MTMSFDWNETYEHPHYLYSGSQRTMELRYAKPEKELSEEVPSVKLLIPRSSRCHAGGVGLQIIKDSPRALGDGVTATELLWRAGMSAFGQAYQNHGRLLRADCSPSVVRVSLGSCDPCNRNTLLS